MENLNSAANICIPDYEWLMIDAGHARVHPHAAEARDGNLNMERAKGNSTQGYVWPWMRMVCRPEWLSRRIAHGLAGCLRE